MHALVERPRAALCAHKLVPIWFNHDLSDMDVATGLWVSNRTDLNRTLVISAYWDIFYENVPRKLREAISFAKKNKFVVMHRCRPYPIAD